MFTCNAPPFRDGGNYSKFEVFKLLEKGVEQDIADRLEAARKAQQPVSFRLTRAGSESFLVLQEGLKISSCVKFTWGPSGIRVLGVLGNNTEMMLQASLTLDDAGECRLRVGNELLTLWQFRKRALEDLLFRF